MAFCIRLFCHWLGKGGFLFSFACLRLVGHHRNSAAAGLFDEHDVFSNLLHWTRKEYPETDQDTTVIMCAYNEEANIARAIHAIFNQNYVGRIRLIVVDNRSTDKTKEIIEAQRKLCTPRRCLEYAYCETPGKANALNCGLKLVCTRYFLTVDADTFLERSAVQRMMNHIACRKCACVAGNLFVENTRKT